MNLLLMFNQQNVCPFIFSVMSHLFQWITDAMAVKKHFKAADKHEHTSKRPVILISLITVHFCQNEKQ